MNLRLPYLLEVQRKLKIGSLGFWTDDGVKPSYCPLRSGDCCIPRRKKNTCTHTPAITASSLCWDLLIS